MGKGIKHTPVGSQLDQSEWEADTSHFLDSGTSFPASPSEGDLFYRTDQHKWYIYDGTAWKETTAQALVPIMVTMNQQKKDYSDQEVYASTSSDHGCGTTTYHNYLTSVVFDSSLSPLIKSGKIYTAKLKAYLKAQNYAGEYTYAALSVDGGAEQGEVSTISSSWVWLTSSEITIKYGQTLQCRHKSTCNDSNGHIGQWKLLLKWDYGYFEITPTNQGFTTLKCIQILLNQNDQARITKMDDTAVTYTNSTAACLACPIEAENVPKDILPIQLKKIERLAGSPMVLIYDGG